MKSNFQSNTILNDEIEKKLIKKSKITNLIGLTRQTRN